MPQTLESIPTNPDLGAAAELAKDVYDNGVTDLTEINALDDVVAETYQIPVHNETGEQTGAVEVKNIGTSAVGDALAVNSGHWSNPNDK